MSNSAFRRALASLSHPLSIAAIVVLLLNDHVWRKVSPSWLTGKLGDAAWLVFAPFLLAALIAWVWPKREDLVGRVSIIGTGLIFGLAKGVPFFNALVVEMLERTNGWSNSLLVDPTDLLVLPALGLAWWIWSHSANRVPANRSGVLVVLAVLVTAGSSPAMYPTGIQRLGEVNGIIYTCDFHSRDGGLTWEEGGDTELPMYSGHYGPWQMVNPLNARVVHRFMPGVSIDRSDDGGVTWHSDFNLGGEEARVASLSKGYLAVGPFDAVLHRASGNLIVAMGLEGVLVRPSSGEWRWVTVGSFSVPELKRFDRIAALIGNELWLGVALFALIVATLTLRFSLRSIIKTVFALVLIGVWLVAWVYWIGVYAFASEGLVFKFLTLALVGLTIWKSAGPRWRRGLLIGAWLVLELWGASGIFFERYGGGMFQFLFGLVLAGVSIAIGLSLKRRPRSDTGLIGFLSVVSVVLIGGWCVWAYYSHQSTTWPDVTRSTAVLTLAFMAATVGLTLLSMVAWAKLKRDVWSILWLVWLMWCLALTMKDGLYVWGAATLALAAISLGVVALGRKRAVLDQVVKVLVILGWIGWAATLIVFKPALPGNNLTYMDGSLFVVPPLVLGALLIGPRQIVMAYRQQRRALTAILLLGVGGVGLYVLPYGLWARGGIPFYTSATFYAVALTVALVVGGQFYVRRLDTPPAIEGDTPPMVAAPD